MDNDLISRSELKTHKFVSLEYMQIGGRHNGKTLERINIAYRKGWNDAIDAIVDNAPTVEYPFYQETYQTGYEEGKNERPHGKCKNCKAYIQYDSRADGYCDIARMTMDGMLNINVSEDFYCSDFEDTREVDNDD